MGAMERRLFLFLGIIAVLAGLYFVVYYGSLIWLDVQAERAVGFVALNVGLVFLGGFLVVRGLKKPKPKRKLM